MAAPEPGSFIFGFHHVEPRYRSDQATALEWLALMHARSGADVRRIHRLMHLVACQPGQIDFRGHSLSDVLESPHPDESVYVSTADPAGSLSEKRMALFEKYSFEAIEKFYPKDLEINPPEHAIHVTCTGYVSPSPLQRLVLNRGWNHQTLVTHAYHMGCYAAFPAIRLASALVSAAKNPSLSSPMRADLVHTELCSLHLDPSRHDPEQVVVQSLFADGFIKYSCSQVAPSEPALAVIAQLEVLVPNSVDQMTWAIGSHGMRMGLSRRVPDTISTHVRGFVSSLCDRAGVHPRDITRFAIHPGGPRILDFVQARLDASDESLWHSREVLRLYGNMSSATLPHIWERLVDDDDVKQGEYIAALAFGPGLTISGAVLQKVA